MQVDRPSCPFYWRRDRQDRVAGSYTVPHGHGHHRPRTASRSVAPVPDAPEPIGVGAAWPMLSDRADLQSPFHAEGRDTILACGKQPGGGKPHRERRARPVEDCSGCDGGPTLAPGAHESTVAQPPAPMMPAGRAHEPGRPPQPLQVVQAVRISSEPSLKFTHRPWVVRACPRMTHRATLHELRLNEYPQLLICRQG